MNKERIKYNQIKQKKENKIMNKATLINFIAENADITKKDAKGMLDLVLEGIMNGIEQDRKVSLLGFGNFTLAERAARKGRNPLTGEELDIPAKVVVKFKPSANLKTAVADNFAADADEAADVDEAAE